jgi:hypothetical protein
MNGTVEVLISERLSCCCIGESLYVPIARKGYGLNMQSRSVFNRLNEAPAWRVICPMTFCESCPQLGNLAGLKSASLVLSSSRFVMRCTEFARSEGVCRVSVSESEPCVSIIIHHPSVFLVDEVQLHTFALVAKYLPYALGNCLR